jgi:hypothetical protein
MCATAANTASTTEMATTVCRSEFSPEIYDGAKRKACRENFESSSRHNAYSRHSM